MLSTPKRHELVIETWGLAMPTAPTGSHDEDPEAWDGYYETLYDTFCTVTRQFDWR